VYYSFPQVRQKRFEQTEEIEEEMRKKQLFQGTLTEGKGSVLLLTAM